MNFEYDALLDWLGKGGVPVPHELAEKRAAICVSCPLNVEPGWWYRHIEDPIAKAIIKTLQLKHSMKITTSHDENLAMCRACGCVNLLHVHAPLLHILQHTKMHTMQRFDDKCWIKNQDNV